MYYSIIIQDKPTNGSFTWNNPYRLNNPFITIIKVLLIPTSDALFTNINQSNTLFSIKCESIVFDKGYNTSHHCYDQSSANTSFSISNSVISNGCVHIDPNCTMWMKNKWLWLIETEHCMITILNDWCVKGIKGCMCMLNCCMFVTMVAKCRLVWVMY